MRDALFCRDLIESEWYQETFKPDWSLREDQSAKSNYWNTSGGRRMSFGINSTITGDRADALFIDDPNELKEGQAIRDKKNERYNAAIHNRVNDRRVSVRIGIQQRTEIDDWTGGRIEQGGWELLRIRSEYRLGDGPTFLGWEDPRTAEGELMDPVRNPVDVLAEDKRTLGTAGYDAQHQQDPQPLEGGMLKLSWFQRYKTAPARTPSDRIVLSLDTANKASELADYSVCTIWLVRAGFFYLLEVWQDQVEFPELKKALQHLVIKHNPHEILVEDKASGTQLIQEYRSTPINGRVYPIVPIEPCGDKVMRASLESPQIEAGLCYLPEDAPWLYAYESEVKSFPKLTKDQVDSTSQFLLRMRTKPAGRQAKAPAQKESAKALKNIF